MTIDETWIQHFIPESNWQSAEWTAAGESCPKWPKMQTSAGKVLASIFWGAQGIMFIDYLAKGITINSEYYITLLVRLKKKYTFTETMHHVISQSQRWQNYMNCILNGFHTCPILQIWPPATTGCLQTSKNVPGKEIWLQWRSDIRN